MGRFVIVDKEGIELVSAGLADMTCDLANKVVNFGKANKVRVFNRPKFYCFGDLIAIAHITLPCQMCGKEKHFKRRIDGDNFFEERLTECSCKKWVCFCCGC
jgi:hypothetical protein